MPVIRFETRPPCAGDAGTTWGPWPSDVLLRSVHAIIVTDASVVERVPIVSIGNIDGTWLQCCPSGRDAAGDASQTIFVNAYPGSGDSVTRNQAGAVLSNPCLAISLPYNLIIPQRHRVNLTVPNGQPGDTISNLFLCIEYSREAYVAKGKPKSAKNNP